MLARENRLTSGRSFAATVRRGRRVGRTSMVVHLRVLPDDQVGPAAQQPRVGLVVGKSVGNAVTRNQVKRRLRHVARARLGSLPVHGELVIRARPEAATASSAVLARDLDEALQRLAGAGRP